MGGSGVIAPHILKLDTRCGEWSASRRLYVKGDSDGID